MASWGGNGQPGPEGTLGGAAAICDHGPVPAFAPSDPGERDLRDLLALSADWIWETDSNHVFTYLSDGVEAAAGLKPGKVLGRTWFDFLPAGARPARGYEAHLDDLRAHRPFREFLHEVPNGAPGCRWLSISGHPRFDQAGAFIGYRGTGRNVTRLIEMREGGPDTVRGELKRPQELLAAVFESLDAGLVVYDADDRLLLANARMNELYPHLRRHARPGMPLRDLLATAYDAGQFVDTPGAEDAADRAEREHWIDSRIEEYWEPYRECEQRLDDGRWVHIRNRRLDNGLFIGLRTDITRIKEREETLVHASGKARHADMLRAALDIMDDGFALYDPDDRLVLFNRAFARMHPGLEDMIEEGTSFEQIARAGIGRGIVDTRGEDPETFLARLLRTRRENARPETITHFADGRWLMRREVRTEDGGIMGIRTDITEIKKREEALALAHRQSEQFLFDLTRTIEAMTMGILVIDADFNVEIMNRAFLSMWKMDPAKVTTGCQFRALMDINRHNGIYDVADDEWEAYVASRIAEIRAGDVAPREFRRADGRTMIYSVTALSNGKRLVSYYDVTDIKQREAALARALEKAKLAEAVIDGIQNPIFVKDEALSFVLVNKAFAGLHDVEPRHMIGRKAADFSLPGDVERYEATERKVLETGHSFEAEEDSDHHGIGNSRIVRKNRVTTLSGKTYVACAIFDITEIKEREKALKESTRENELFRNIIDNVPVAIYAKQPDLKLIYVNQGWCDLTGVPAAEAIGKTDGDIFGPDGEAFMRDDRAVLETRQPQEFEETATEADGSVRHQLARKSAMIASDGSLYLIGSTTNITEAKRREQELRDAQQKAVLADRAKSEFLANMSHEIRTPMNGVLGMAELLSKTELNAKQRTFIDIIVKSGNALLTIINDILDFSKIDAGQLVLDPAPFSLVEAIEDVAALVSTRAKEKDIELIIRVDPGLPEMFVGDAGRIRQIITNLLGNAVKFTDAGHVLVDVNGAPENGRAALRIAVTDTGIGIPREKLALIFEKFSQVDASSTRRHEGTGLGLAITSRLVQMMGGEIGVESESGKGSTFWFTLTLPVSEESGQRRVAPVDVTGARVLIVDDNAVNRAILSEQMASWSFDSCAAESGEEGIRVLRAAVARGVTVDCVVLDYQMPGMTGAEACRIIRSTEEIADTPIVMLTSVDQSMTNAQYRDLGIDAQLIKPARSSHLLETLVSAVQRRRMSGVPGWHDAEPPPRPAAARPDIPLRADPPAAAPVRTPSAPGTGSRPSGGDGHRVDLLVAEDNEVNQLVFTQILSETDLSFEIVGNGKRALEAHAEMNPRMILMDVSMPEMNGLEATAAIRRREAETGGHVPIIGVTAHALKGDRERCLEAGMDDYLPKPISPKALLEKVARWSGQAAEDRRDAG